MFLTGEYTMALSTEEKALIEEALSLYIQVISQRAHPSQVQQIAAVAQNIVKKLDSVGSGGGKGGNKPNGISDEWFKNVCMSCDKLSGSGCADKVTEKFPGKCDPILHFERDKIMKKK
jgi:hypothetical protein